jgi:hypothetical protein
MDTADKATKLIIAATQGTIELELSNSLLELTFSELSTLYTYICSRESEFGIVLAAISRAQIEKLAGIIHPTDKEA